MNADLPNVPAALMDQLALVVAAWAMLEGVHIAELVSTHGVLVVSPTQAKKKGATRAERVEHSGPLTSVEFTYPNAQPQVVEIHHHGGALVMQVWDEVTKAYVHEPLTQLNSERRKNKDGTWRFYVNYEIPDPLGGAPKKIRTSVLTDDNDRQAGFNRSKYIRQIPPGSDEYKRIYPRRSDAESINRGIEDSLYLKRARCFGADRQLLELFGHMLSINAQSAARHRARTQPAAAAA